MKSIRRFVYAATLTLSALNLAPSVASAQDARGTFKLTHDVHWQNHLVPAGEYAFSLESTGPSELLQLRSLNGTSRGVIMLVNDSAPSKPANVSRLLLVSRPSGTFVTAMELPESGITLHFTVPAETREMAQADSTAAAPSAR